VIEVEDVNNSSILKQNKKLKSSPIFIRLKFQVVTLYEAQTFCYYSTQVSFTGNRIYFFGLNKTLGKFYAWKIAVNSLCFYITEVRV
jgi:hypothetical protein